NGQEGSRGQDARSDSDRGREILADLRYVSARARRRKPTDGAGGGRARRLRQAAVERLCEEPCERDDRLRRIRAQGTAENAECRDESAAAEESGALPAARGKDPRIPGLRP